MISEKRRVLSIEEKQQLLDKNPDCYICNETLAGYNSDEIQYDHIYNYADGYPQELSNFSPVHASRDERKQNCHKAKGQKSPVQYREEVRITKYLKSVSGLGDLCKKAVQSVYSITTNFSEITINGKTVPMYNQRINNKDNFYFFHEIDTKYIENDEQIQLRPLEPKILPLIFNLKTSVQLFPSLGRLDELTKTIKIFDGQHKAVAQIIGNNRKYISCLVFVHPRVEELRLVIYQAHTDFVQQKYKKSHIDSKLAAIYEQKIDSYRLKMGDPNAPFTEEIILQGETRAKKSQFLLSSIIEECKHQTNFINDFVAQDKREQKLKPMLWQSLERLVSELCNLDPISETSESDNNYRAEEIENLSFIINLIQQHSINEKWQPSNPDSITHKLSRTFYYRTSFNTWIRILVEALTYAYEQRTGRKMTGVLCYRAAFPTEIKQRFSEVIKKLFEHPLWVKDDIQEEISTSNKDIAISRIFDAEGLDYIWLTKI